MIVRYTDYGFDQAAITNTIQTYLGLLPIKPLISQNEAETGLNTDTGLPIQFSSPYPNPFNTAISIPFALSEDMEIRISVYDITGREIAVLQDGLLETGQYQLSWNAIELKSGVYIIQLRTAGTIQTHKTILMK